MTLKQYDALAAEFRQEGITRDAFISALVEGGVEADEAEVCATYESGGYYDDSVALKMDGDTFLGIDPKYPK